MRDIKRSLGIPVDHDASVNDELMMDSKNLNDNASYKKMNAIALI